MPKGWKLILSVAWPLIIANSFWNIQMTIDRIFLGQHSTEALGAAMAVFGVFWAPMALLQQTAAYVTTFVAQYYGAKQYHKIGPALWHAVYFSIAGGIIFLGLVFLAPLIFHNMGHPESLTDLEVNYFEAICFSALPTAIVSAVSGYYTGLGQAQKVIWINGVGMILNIIFDYLLIFGHYGFPELGVSGAGYATAISNAGSAIFGTAWVLLDKNQAQFHLKNGLKFDLKFMKRFLKFGLPSGFQWSLEGLAFTVFMIFVGQMPNGEAALAASGIAVTVMMLAILPAIGVGQAVSVLVGQNLGDNRPKEAEHAAWNGVQIAAIYIISMGVTFLLFPGFYLSWFENKHDLEIWNQVSVIVPYLLMFVATFTVFDSMNMVFSFALKGAGDTRFVTLVALALPWPIMVLPTYFVREFQNGVYWAWGFASVFIVSQALVFLIRFRGEKWKSMRVIEMEVEADRVIVETCEKTLSEN